ncbi:fatty acid CoA ligase family protein [Engelhardtia mirabilis]|uniref:fatty acid CoA ligase family protein n=1 Tax=Engelhardtia mirabilis TaxID=2528011 RepID=UPI003AF35FF6
MANVARHLDRFAADAPERPAVRAAVRRRPGQWESQSFAVLAARSRRIASGLLAQGLVRGDRVSLLVEPGIDLIAITYACLRAGLVPVLIDPGMGRSSFLACVERMAPAALIGVRRAHVARLLFRHAFRTCRVRVGVGPGPHFGALRLDALEAAGDGRFTHADTTARETAAILFTSGSTGPAKGVVYTHGIFEAQVAALRDLYDLQPGEVDVACFPLFALFDNALGMTSVFPDMDPTRPAQCDPALIHRAVVESGATLAFGSPAIWRRVAPWCAARGERLGGLRRVLVAGAPVPPQLVEALRAVLPDGGDVHTPYGATESLPVSSVSGAEIVDASIRSHSETGGGNCIGRPAPGMDLRVIRIDDGPIASWSDELEVAAGELGELCVRGPVVTPAYAEDPGATALAKIDDGRGGVWHRMGDLGCVDGDGRFWFQGRKSHRLETELGVLPCVPTENAFNTHPAVRRTALVGVGARGSELPVLVIELEPSERPTEALADAILAHGRDRVATASRVTRTLFHPGFPVDVRHNAKIDRPLLAEWATEQLR